MQKVFDRLLTIKSIVTIMLTIVFCILSLCGTIDGGQFLTIFTVVIGFYFGTQAQKQAQAAQTAKPTEAAVANVVIEDMAVQSAVDAAVHKETRPPDESEDVVIAGFAG